MACGGRRRASTRQLPAAAARRRRRRRMAEAGISSSPPASLAGPACLSRPLHAPRLAPGRCAECVGAGRSLWVGCAGAEAADTYRRGSGSQSAVTRYSQTHHAWGNRSRLRQRSAGRRPPPEMRRDETRARLAGGRQIVPDEAPDSNRRPAATAAVSAHIPVT